MDWEGITQWLQLWIKNHQVSYSLIFLHTKKNNMIKYINLYNYILYFFIFQHKNVLICLFWFCCFFSLHFLPLFLLFCSCFTIFVFNLIFLLYMYVYIFSFVFVTQFQSQSQRQWIFFSWCFRYARSLVACPFAFKDFTVSSFIHNCLK